MNIRKTLVFAVLAFLVCTSMAARAWSIQEDRGDTVLIKCGDGSNSLVGKSNGGWTVISAGNNGKTGGQFAIVGQAAVAGCGE